MVITEEFFDVILKLFARGVFFTWIYSVLLSAVVVMMMHGSVFLDVAVIRHYPDQFCAINACFPKIKTKT